MSAKNEPKPLIYLAGGFKTGWQQRVHQSIGKAYLILDPSEHGIEHRDEYTRWDLAAIRKCQVVLAFMEGSNPGGYNLAMEVGYAHALGKPILFVDNLDTDRSRYFEMVRAVASKTFCSLEDALAALEDPTLLASASGSTS